MAGLFGALAAGAESKSSQVLDRLPEFMLWGPSKTGQTVSYMSALQVTTILACCRVLANGVSQIPWQVMKARAGGRGADPDPTHPVYKLLNRRPNFYQTSFEFRSTLVLHLALAGNAFLYISRGAGGNILELIPLEPGRVSVTRARDLSLSYQVSSEEGFTLSNLTSREIWHIRGLSWNSWMGTLGTALVDGGNPAGEWTMHPIKNEWPNAVTVLSDTAIRGKDLDDEKANAAKSAAEEALKNAKSDIDQAKAQSELAVMAAQIAALRKFREKR